MGDSTTSFCVNYRSFIINALWKSHDAFPDKDIDNCLHIIQNIQKDTIILRSFYQLIVVVLVDVPIRVFNKERSVEQPVNYLIARSAGQPKRGIRQTWHEIQLHISHVFGEKAACKFKLLDMVQINTS